MAKSLPDRPFWIESLRKNPELPAIHITATIEKKDPEPEPELLLVTWLNASGLKLIVAVCKETEDNNTNAETRSHQINK